MPPGLDRVKNDALDITFEVSKLVKFLSIYIPLRKVQIHQSALMYVAMATMQLFGLFLKLKTRLFFKYFHLRETSCEITFYALDIKIV